MVEERLNNRPRKTLGWGDANRTMRSRALGLCADVDARDRHLALVGSSNVVRIETAVVLR